MKLIFEKSGSSVSTDYVPAPPSEFRATKDILPASMLRSTKTILPEISELDLVRHYSDLAKRTTGVDQSFYPLGSCTMKYNPKLGDASGALPGFAQCHPLAPESTIQGWLALLYDLKRRLAEITGMDAVTLAPMAGAHGEWTGMYCIRRYHERRGDIAKRTEVLVPDAAHGTNPASAAMCGFSIVKVDSDANGRVDLDDLDRKLSDKTAALMLTNPNTLGVFESNIVEIATRVHRAGGLLYYDGANLNAICGKARPGDMGFDVVHLNVHKTFGTPHGGGGPGGGPVGVKAGLADYLPLPDIKKTDDGFYHWINDGADSIGRVGSFYGNVRVYVLAYAYILRCGGNGLAEVAERAALNANYLRAALKDQFPVAYDTPTFHEFVCAPTEAMLAAGVHTLDIAKRLIDFGYHPMTIYFPLIVKEAMMIEPTETESKETLDAFIAAMLRIADEIQTTPEIVKNAPTSAPVRRIDEVKAAKDLKLTYRPAESN